jgi:hypothetical protein
VEFLLAITEADDRGAKDGVWGGLFSKGFKRVRIAGLQSIKEGV